MAETGAKSKATYPLPDVIDPPGTRCVQLSLPDDPGYIRAFWGHLTNLGKWTAWERDDQKRGTLAAQRWWQMWHDAIALFYSDDPCPGGSESDMYLRPKPNNPCVLQYSNDNVTWYDGFDFSACPPDSGGTVINIDIDASKTYYDTVINNYDGTVDSLLPTAYNRNLLCWGVRAYVQSAVEAFIAYAEQQEAEADNALNIAAMILVAGAAIAGTIALGPAGGAAAGALAYGFLIGGATLAVWAALDTTDLGSLRDDGAIDQVVCCIMDGVAGSYPSFAAWQGPYTCNGLSSTAQRIKDIVDAQLPNEDAYAMMLAVMADYQPFEMLLPDCVCDDWCRVFDFGTNARGEDGWTIQGGSVRVASLAATEVIGQRQYLRIEYVFSGPVTITGWEVVYSLYNSSQAGGAIQFFLNGVEVTSERSNLGTGIDRTQSASDREFTCDTVFIFVRDTLGTNPQSGVNEVTLTGRGTSALPWAGGAACT